MVRRVPSGGQQDLAAAFAGGDGCDDGRGVLGPVVAPGPELGHVAQLPPPTDTAVVGRARSGYVT